MITLPPMVPVQSSNLAAVGYDAPGGWLYVSFNSGKIYRYKAPSSVYNGLLAAWSHGTYFNDFVRNVYYCERIR